MTPAAGTDDATTPRIQEVGDRIFAYLQPDGGWCVSNAGIIAGADRTIVIDTTATIARATRLRRAVEARSGAVPLTLVNTHHHGDHIFGNCVFGPGIDIVAHNLARPEIEATGLGLQQLWPAVDWGEVKLVLPTITFEGTLTLHTGKDRLELIHVGPAHTTNDIVGWLPDEKVLFAGDVLMNGITPFCLMGSVAGSLAAIGRLRNLGASTIVPGHGAVCGPEIFDATETYLRWIQSLAVEGVARKLSPLDLARKTDLREYAALRDAERIVGNLVRAYADLAGDLTGMGLGAPVDVLAAFRDIVEFHGKVPGCSA